MSEQYSGPDIFPDGTDDDYSADAWAARIEDAQKVFRDYQDRCDKVDKLYANLNALASVDRDREYQIFWANVQVTMESIYSRPPIPVVVPRFRDRRPLYRSASELLERSTAVAFDLSRIDSVLTAVRDDLTVVARGASWVRYETSADSDTGTERICIEHIHRQDFLHEPAREWCEVGWVARRAWLTRPQMRERFEPTSGNAYEQANYGVDTYEKQIGATSRAQKAGVWEIWCRESKRVYWWTEGVDVLLDESEPHLSLEGFYPCPEPAYGTLQRGSLMPVPDFFFCRDQLMEINELTNRIHALSEALRVKGFYPAGVSEVGEAVERAFKSADDSALIVPLSNWAAFGGTGEAIVWLPIQMVAETIMGCVNLRRQVIEDVQQIMGISDIMRGDTDPNETLGAQQLKSQYGSVRIRGKQRALVRVSKDLVNISAEIMAEKFKAKTLLQMSQLGIPTDADIKAQIRAIEAQIKQITRQAEAMAQGPQAQQMAQENPEQAQQMVQQAQSQIEGLAAEAEKIAQTVTIEQIMGLLHDERLRPFVLDVETDSTIQPDEQAEKQARTEFVTALGALIGQFTPVIQTQPQMAGMIGEIIKFALAPYRAGRELEGKIDEAIEQMVQSAQSPQPNPEVEAAQAKIQTDAQIAQASLAEKQLTAQIRQQEAAEKAEAERQRLALDIDLRDLEGRQKIAEHNQRMQNLAAGQAMAQEKHQQEMAAGMLDNEGRALQNEKLRLEIARVAQSTINDERQATIEASVGAVGA